uniref:CHHC U11-48K-type domain-containing protein n=1 Tax=Podarcis muralis TaxID=64176 RepID=A0A670IHG8_PODMU
MDPERLVQCPYDKNHQIRACRLPYHLVKCRKNNQKIARELATCPYNARHRVPKQELKLHIATCENKVSPEVLEGKRIAPVCSKTQSSLYECGEQVCSSLKL